VDFRSLFDKSNDIDALWWADRAQHTPLAVMPVSSLGRTMFIAKTPGHNVWETPASGPKKRQKQRSPPQMGTQMHARIISARG